MPRPSSLPPEWACLTGKVHHVQRVSDKEYCCSCPTCGGVIHQHGELPDRCRLFTDDHPTLWCRRCGLKAYPDQFGDNNYTRPSPEEIEKRRGEQEAAEMRRKQSAEHALGLLRAEGLWEHYHEQLPGYGYRLWAGRGLDESWQSWFGVGYCPDWRGGDTLTIPYFDHDRDVLNIKHRLLKTNEQGGKYRYELSGQPQHLYLTDPATSVEGHVIVVEGEIKAMVTFSRFQELPIVAIPGATPPKYLLPQLEKCDRITLVMDPGAEIQAYDLAKALGAARCRVLITAMKIDDGILAANLTGRDIRYLLSQAKEI